MVSVINIRKLEGFHPSMEFVHCKVNTNGDYYDSKLKKVIGCLISNETNVGVLKVALSGQRVTITCTSGDVVSLLIWGEP